MKKIMLIIGITMLAYNLTRFKELVPSVDPPNKSSLSSQQGNNAVDRKVNAEQVNQNNSTSYLPMHKS